MHKRMDWYILVYLHSKILHSNKKKRTADTSHNMDASHRCHVKQMKTKLIDAGGSCAGK